MGRVDRHFRSFHSSSEMGQFNVVGESTEILISWAINKWVML